MADQHNGVVNAAAQADLSTDLSGPAGRRRALDWGDRYLDLALRCYIAGFLSDAQITSRVRNLVPKLLGQEDAP